MKLNRWIGGVAALFAGLTLFAADLPAYQPPAKKYNGTWLTDYQAAKTLAEKSGKPLIVWFTGSDWCGWCMKLDKEVFSKSEFKLWSKNNASLVVADFPRKKPQSAKEKKQNEELAQKYGIRGFPTILIFDSTGKQLGQTGYREGGAAAYVKHLQSFLKQPAN